MCSMDILGPFPRSSEGYKYIILLVDYFTRYLEASPIKDEKADTVADFFLLSGVLRHGAINRILTDRAQNFCAKLSEAVYMALKSKHIRTSAYHPQSNGLAEKQCKTLSDMLSMYCRTDQKDWHRFLPYIVFAYNTARQESTKQSPFKLLYGYEARLPIDLALHLPSQFKELDDIYSRFEDARSLVRQSIVDAQQRQKKHYNSKHRPVEYKRGDLVSVYTKLRKVGRSEKLLHNFHGPKMVIGKHMNSPVTYLLKDKRTGKVTKAHIARIKRYHSKGIDEISDDDIWSPEEPISTSISGDTQTIEHNDVEPVKSDDEIEVGQSAESIEVHGNEDN
jgi:hypothetical protein